MWLPVLLSLAAMPLVLASNILVVVPLPARSHIMLFEPLVLELAQRGHQVTYVTSQKLKNPVKNVEQIIIPQAHPKDHVPPNFFQMRHFTPLHNMIILPMMTAEMNTNLLEAPSVQELLNSNRKFDALIVEAFLVEAVAAGLAHKYQAPLIGYGTFMPSYWVNYMVGNEAPTSYIPDPFTNLPQKMTFSQRLLNAVFGVVAHGWHFGRHLATQDAIMRRFFGEDLPPIVDIMTNTSLLLVNDHYSLSFPRPAVPNLISIGGLHVKPPKPLPEDLKKYLDESVNGAILLSFGSNLKSTQLGQERIQMFLNVFSKLKQNILWKFEEDLPNKPKNVLTSDWLPQSDILAHPNLKLFITHGGLLSTTEAVERGVPIVGIPIFGDQPMNMRQSVNAGVGLSLDFDLLSEENLLEAIQEVLNNSKYRAAAKARSAALKDVQIGPMEQAVWWVEYVIRHKGAPHLRSAAQHLTWYQRQQLDVAAVLLIAAATILYIIKLTICAIVRLLCGKKSHNDKNKKKN